MIKTLYEKKKKTTTIYSKNIREKTKTSLQQE